jgi:hypothetical protein
MNENLVTDAKYAFVVAEREKYHPGIGTEANWQHFLANIRDSTYPPAETLTIHDNIWLIPLATGLKFLSDLTKWGESYSVPIRILFLAEAPTWIKYPPDAKEKTSQPTP